PAGAAAPRAPAGAATARRRAPLRSDRVSDDLRNQMTRSAYDALEAELHRLETTERDAMAERIRTARSWGDLKENAEYHDAKDAQAHLETRIKRLRQRLRDAVVVEADDEGGSFAFGRTA